jgi:RimJ/RimL family protein N-acetyltransferase
VVLREVRQSDAATLFEMLNAPEVSRYVTPPPESIVAFERFIAWAHRSRAAGRFVCFGIVPDGSADAIGILQVRALAPGFAVAEWGFAIGRPYWGRGIFQAAAEALLGFAFGTLGTHRVEGRSSVVNGRANRAFEKIGATAEGVLRKSFRRDGLYHDQIIWAITADEWYARRDHRH